MRAPQHGRAGMPLKAFFLCLANLAIETEAYDEMVGIYGECKYEGARYLVSFYCRDGSEMIVDEMGAFHGTQWTHIEPTAFQLEFMAMVLRYYLVRATALREMHEQEIADGYREDGDVYWSAEKRDHAGELEAIKLKG